MDDVMREFEKFIESGRKFLLVSHPRPDGDTSSSNLATANILRRKGKEVISFCLDTPGDSLRFLPRVSTFVSDLSVFGDPSIDRIIVFDAGDLRYAGIADRLSAWSKRPLMVNIDHHATNEYFGDINIVHLDAVSTTHVLYRIFQEVRWPIDSDIATCLLTGLMTDTGNFTNLATTHESMRIASDLILCGGKVQKILLHTHRNKSVAMLKLWGKAMSRLKIDPETGDVTTMLYQKDFDDCGLDSESSEGLTNFLNVLGTARSILVLKVMEGGMVRGGLRTSRDDVDVSQIALQYGGGGHKKAAGFQMKGRVVETPSAWIVQPEEPLAEENSISSGSGLGISRVQPANVV